MKEPRQSRKIRNVGKFVLNNLRNAQHHAGQLNQLLGRRAGIGIAYGEENQTFCNCLAFCRFESGLNRSFR